MKSSGSGVLDWLLMQKEAGAGKVGKAQLLAYLAENGVPVTESMKGASDAASARPAWYSARPCSTSTGRR